MKAPHPELHREIPTNPALDAHPKCGHQKRWRFGIKLTRWSFPWFTPWKFNSSPLKIWCLEDDPFLLGNRSRPLKFWIVIIGGILRKSIVNKFGFNVHCWSTLPETNISHLKNEWLEDEISFLLGFFKKGAPLKFSVGFFGAHQRL